MAKVIAFVDGFNVYHALMAEDQAGNTPYAAYRWLDYWKLAECFVRAPDMLAAVYYFTAYVSWSSPEGKAKKRRHEALVAANGARGVHAVLGRFRPVQRVCMARCRQLYETYEEKRTDVNIAVKMVELAARGACRCRRSDRSDCGGPLGGRRLLLAHATQPSGA